MRTILFFVLVLAQPPAVPQGPPSVPKVAPSAYAVAISLSKASGKPLVVFVGVEPRRIDGAITVGVSSLPDGTRHAILVSVDGETAYWLAATATDEEIQRRAVRPLAVVFRAVNQDCPS